MTSAGAAAADLGRDTSATPVFFLSDSTGISAETMGNALLIQFPQLRFDRRLIPFISTPDEARRVVEVLDRAAEGPVTPIAFTTAATDEIREVLHTTKCPMIDFFELHISRVESVFGVPAARVAAQLHGVGDVQRYNARMAAIEYSIEHDDGQSLRAMDKAEVVLIAPSRCGKTPTTMYLALQHGLFVANYPLVEEDLETTDLPRPIRHLKDRVVGLVATPGRLSEVRQQRRPNSRYASLEQCTYELRRAEAMYAANRLPVINSTTKSVEEMSTLIVQTLQAAHAGRRSGTQRSGLVSANVKWFSSLGMADLEEVGGKNSSLGEMIGNLASAGVRVPDGFATTASAFRDFVSQEGLAARITGLMEGLDTDDVDALSRVGKQVRTAIVEQPLQPALEQEVREAYATLSERLEGADAGQLRGAVLGDGGGPAGRVVRGAAGDVPQHPRHRGVLQAIHEVFASLYNDRAIAYRVHHGFDHDDVALSAGVQRMVRSDVGASGVMFTMDTESGFTDAVFVTASYGLGEAVVQGAVNPDEWYVWKPGLAAGTPAVLTRGVGGKATKMVFTDDPSVGRTTEFVDIGPGGADAVLADRRGGRGAGAPRGLHRAALRPADGHRVGQGRGRRASSTSSRPGRRRCSRAAAAPACSGTRWRGAQLRRGARRGPRDRAEGRRRRGTHPQVRRPDAGLHRGRGARRRHDRPRLGADHEAGQRHRHEPRRADLPRRDHRPRAGHPRGRGHRVGDPRPGRGS